MYCMEVIDGHLLKFYNTYPNLVMFLTEQFVVHIVQFITNKTTIIMILRFLIFCNLLFPSIGEELLFDFAEISKVYINLDNFLNRCGLLPVFTSFTVNINL